MKVDLYTKAVLTVIAACLVIIVLADVEFISKAHAGPMGNYGLVPLNKDGSITVKLGSMETIEVEIVGIDTSDELDVNIEEVGGFSIGSSVPVEN